MRNSVEVFVPRSAAGVRTLHEGLLRELASYGPVLVGLSGYELGSSGEGAAVAAAVQAHGLRLQLHLPCSGTSRARAGWFVDECARAGVHDILLLPGEPPQPGEESHQDGFRSMTELLRFIHARSGGLRCAVPGYPRGAEGERGGYAADLKELRLQLRSGAGLVVCQPVYDAQVCRCPCDRAAKLPQNASSQLRAATAPRALSMSQAVAELVADLGADLSGAVLLPTMLPLGSRTGFARIVRGLRLSPPAWLMAQVEAARSDEEVRKVSDAALAKLARDLCNLHLPAGAELSLHVATLNSTDSAALLRAAGFHPLHHRTRGPALAPPPPRPLLTSSA